MRFEVLFIVLSTLLTFIFCQPPPYLHRPDGFLYKGLRDNKVVLEAFYDHLCSDSAHNWAFFQSILDKFSDNDVSLIIHIFPLPYHHNAFFAAIAGKAVLTYKPSEFIKYMTDLFKGQNEFITEAVMLNEIEVQAKLAQFVSDHAYVNATFVIDAFKSDSEIYSEAVLSWYYGCTRRVSYTPYFLANGIEVVGGSSFNGTQWESFIHALLKEQSIIESQPDVLHL